MAYRLVLILDEGPSRVPLENGDNLLGSSSECAVTIPHPTVSRRHAVLRVGADGVTISDLESRNGVRVDSRRVPTATIEAGTRFQVGGVTIRLEEVADHDLEAAVVLDSEAAASTSLRSEERGDFSTFGSGPAEAFSASAAYTIYKILYFITTKCSGCSAG